MADYVRGEQLRKLRGEKHASQEAVAAEIGVSTKTLRTWENGGKIRWPNAKRIGAFYGVDPEALVSRDDLNTPGNNAAGPTQLERIEQRLDEIHAGLQQAGLIPAATEAPAPPPPGELGRRVAAHTPKRQKARPARSPRAAETGAGGNE